MNNRYSRFLNSDVALYGMLASVALVFSYIESLIPINWSVPGIKLGLANIVIVWVLYSMGVGSAALVNVLRVFLIGFLFGNLYSMSFSLAGAIVSLLLMWGCKHFKVFNPMGVSVIGAVGHNLAQIVVAMVVLDNVWITSYLPFLIISGVVSGIAIGIIGGILVKKVKINKPGDSNNDSVRKGSANRNR